MYSLTAVVLRLEATQLKDCRTCLSLLATGETMFGGGRRGSWRHRHAEGTGQYSCQEHVVGVVGLLPCTVYLALWAQVAGRGSVGRERLPVGVQAGHMVQV